MNTTDPYQHLPPLSNEEYAALKEDIREHGVLVPVEVDEHGNTLDGHHRRRVCAELGITAPTVTRAGMTEAQKHEHALKLNLQRRNLTSAQKRVLISAELERDPSRSDRAIARLLGVDHKTVAAVRNAESATGGEIPQEAHPAPDDSSSAPRPTDDTGDRDVKVMLLARKITWTCDSQGLANALYATDRAYAAKLATALERAHG